ncbi:hypothetical protein MMC18_006973 [Xylographa bjoerkii]|nr:hypothetical protein [Xylographa bjoerkii]
MDYTGDDFEMPDYDAPIDTSKFVMNDADLVLLNNSNLFEMDMDETLKQFAQENPRVTFSPTGQLPDATLTGNLSGPMNVIQQKNPYSQSLRTQITAQAPHNPTQTVTVGNPQHENPSSFTYVWDPKNWTEIIQTDPYPPGLDADSEVHQHFGIKFHTLPKHIDPTFLYHGQGYTKAGSDDAAEDLALSDEDTSKPPSAQPGHNVRRPRDTEGPAIPYRTKPPNTPAEYPWAKPHKPAGTNTNQRIDRPRAQIYRTSERNLDEPIAEPWDIPYQRGTFETGISSANPRRSNPYSANPSQANPYHVDPYPPNPYLANPNQANPYQLADEAPDATSPDTWQPLVIPRDASRSNTSTPTTDRARRGSRIPVLARRDTARKDLRGRAHTTSQIGSNTNPDNRKDPRGRAEPVNRVNSNTRLNKNNRRAANQLPRNTYDPLPAAPPSWTSTRGKEYVYEISGELQNGTYYSCTEIEDFLYQNPRRANMTLWIQRLPADSAARYPYSESRRCRFLHCFMTNGTINQGHYRIAFDELTNIHDYHDPMHNAGYVHLYCFEKYLDFPKVCYDLNVQVDERILPLEPRRKNGYLYQTNNRMILSTQPEINVASDFLDYCNAHSGRGPPDYPHYTTRNAPAPDRMGHENTLVHRLWQMKIRHDQGTIKSAEKRGAKASTGVSHMGNLEIEDFERALTRKRANQIIRTENPQVGGRRRNNPETTIREERARKKRKVQEDQMQLATSLGELQNDDDEDDAEDYDDEADAEGERDSLFYD